MFNPYLWSKLIEKIEIQEDVSDINEDIVTFDTETTLHIKQKETVPYISTNLNLTWTDVEDTVDLNEGMNVDTYKDRLIDNEGFDGDSQ